MKRILQIIIPIIILGAFIYKFQSPLYDRALPILQNIQSFFVKRVPCEEPIPYVLGTFDTDFNISEEYFLNAIALAEEIWEKPFGINLFNYNKENISGSFLKINLIYDYRQQATDKLASIGIVVEENKDSYDALNSKFLQLKQEYKEEEKTFDNRLEVFNEKRENYQQEIKYWNSKGGAPQKEFRRLEVIKKELEDESRILETMQNNLNDTIDEINALVVVLNRLASSLNISVEKYNTINTSRGESFEGGVYMSDGFNQEINIYEFENKQKLVRVLAHELGHALGILHLDDPQAIMYEFNQGDNSILTNADLGALKAKCVIN